MRSETGKIELVIQYLPRDFWRANFGYYFSFRTFLIFATQFSVFGILIGVLLFGEKISLRQLGIVVITAILFTAITSLIMAYWSMSNGLKKRNSPCTYVFWPDKVEIISDEFQSEVDWEHFSTASESGRYFSLFSKDQSEHLLPVRCFRDGKHLEEFRSLLKSKSRFIKVKLSELKK